jgi:hypothetical protein
VVGEVRPIECPQRLSARQAGVKLRQIPGSGIRLFSTWFRHEEQKAAGSAKDDETFSTEKTGRRQVGWRDPQS